MSGPTRADDQVALGEAGGGITVAVAISGALMAAVNLLSRSRIKNRNRFASSPRSMSRLRACWVTRLRGVGGDAGDVHAAAAVLDDHQDVEAAQEDGVDVGEAARSKQGSPLLRWALYEAGRYGARASSPDHDYYVGVAARLGGQRAALSVARKMARRCHHRLRALGAEALAPPA
jgi:hypothetical protein